MNKNVKSTLLLIVALMLNIFNIFIDISIPFQIVLAIVIHILFALILFTQEDREIQFSSYLIFILLGSMIYAFMPPASFSSYFIPAIMIAYVGIYWFAFRLMPRPHVSN